ncbi:MAG TPA: DUF3830 family protein [Thermoanaerobacterales bacterium]|jgi:hypothetical protein|nr:DUF3830 family protein [Thermoanaerobacterales bacterium]
MNKIKIMFERGGELTVDLNDRAPETVKRVLEILPLTSTVMHTRWCGREVSMGISTRKFPPLENHTNIVSKFDVTYWRNWEDPRAMPESPAAEAIALYYGPELLRYHDGLIRVNVIGRVRWEQEELLEEIGERIWKRGVEEVRVERI